MTENSDFNPGIKVYDEVQVPLKPLLFENLPELIECEVTRYSG